MSRSFLRTSRSGFIGERQLNAHFFHSASFTRNSTCVNHMNMFPHFDGSRMLIWTMHRSFATRVLLLDRTTPSEDNGGCAEQANTSVLERTCEFDPLTAEKLVRISKYRFLRACLRMKNLVQIPMQEFLDECTQHIGMTNAEAHACLRDFNDAGLIVVVRDLVFLYPFAVLSSFHQSIGVSSDYSAPLRSRRDAIDRALKVLGEEKEAIDARIKLKRNRFWSYVALYSAIQMFIVCHFTFIDFDWDIMEPVSYFLTSGTAIVLYGWFLYHGAESSFEHVDGQVLTNALKKEYARSKFPYARWAELSEERKQVDLEIQKIEEWLRVQG